MKRKLFPIVLIAALLLTTALSVFNAGASDPKIPYGNTVVANAIGNNYEVIDVNPAIAAPTIDGAVAENEYSSYIRLSDQDMWDKGTTTYGYVDMYSSYDAEFYYFAFVVQEDAYKFKATNAYSKIVPYFSFQNADILGIFSRMQCTLSINTNETGALFTGIGYMPYTAAAKPAATIWTYMNTTPVMPSKSFTRGTDAAGKAITTYEFALSKAVLNTAYTANGYTGSTMSSNFGYFNFQTEQYDASGTKVGNANYYVKLTNDQKAEIIANDPSKWCASFTLNVLNFVAPATHTITWSVNGVETKVVVNDGVLPVFEGSTDKPEDEGFTYSFTGWDKEIVAATGDVTYTAQYSSEPKTPSTADNAGILITLCVLALSCAVTTGTVIAVRKKHN